MTTSGIEVWAPDGVGEVRAGDDLAALVLPLVELADGDVLVVTSKVVSKAEGRVVSGTTREEALAGETVRVVARRGPTTIVRTRHGLTMAAAGIDASNVEVGSVVLLPLDPDGSARRLRAAVRERTGRNVGVVVTDTAGRAWREGQTDIAVGAAGLLVAEDFGGRVDAHGNPLVVTAPAVADEIAGVAELASGKLGARPFAVVRGRADLVLAPGDDGPGARALVRPEGGDLFGYGAREAVVRAVLGDPADQAPFGSPVPAEELAAVLRLLPGVEVAATEDGVSVTGGPAEAVAALAFAHGWRVDGAGSAVEARLRPATT
ncbi:coenzyme F420-0:L-glutamate ligase [Nocardioides sp. zg-579]|uniref:Coenzyme F420-0:L-glutamate ligase n=1 Tax=Nocardioides marmotae TaxID=2663857 RepID=A0A6I3J6G4_9ACTN|nr:coenzyme F420-0:L-glutamate ligase [Nocardioides marmotae]MCR6031433.1 coenzyme F420-0:L-glutamate ligase [Gordonia jinghuaiqii]MTB95072.1 coenzyme F420-0:L-glutamate ligase [Nocardioides marmotae]QKE02432.1 coenzyme F420-0:L-glutamate ligase [Nocardioides marmotae]